MSSEDGDRRYAAEGLVWSAGPNRFFAAEVEGAERHAVDVFVRATAPAPG